MRIGSFVCALAAGGTLLSVALAAAPDQDGASTHGRPHMHGVGHLDLAVVGSDVEVELFAPGATLVGFERAPQTDSEEETLRLARENLRAGDAMIRFSTHAGCRLASVRVEADLPEPAPAPPSAAGSAPTEAIHADIAAYYRFACNQPQALDSAALGLFSGFPALQRVLVHYAMPEGRGAAELTRANPVVSFVPF